MQRDLRRDPDAKVIGPKSSIRRFCVECMGGSMPEVEKCTAPKCWLYPYRLGIDPRRADKPRTQAQIDASVRAGERLKQMKKEE